MQMEKIKIAVIVPIRNEKANIAECIHAIYNSNLPLEWELNVICVDGLSNDGTINILNELQQNYPSLEIITNYQQITPVAFNLGVKHSKYCDYIQRVDARQIISSNYIQNAVRHLQQNSNIWCVGGRMNNVYQNTVGKTIAAVTSTSIGMGLGNSRVKEKSGFVDTVHTPMYPNWVFDRIGYFDEQLIRNQDDDFNFRVRKEGGKIYLDTTIYTNYYVRGSLQNFSKQFFQYGYWKVYVNRKHKTLTTIRQVIPPAFALYLIIFVFCWLLGPTVGTINGTILLFYIIIIGITSFLLSSSDETLNFWDIAKTFCILHLSYGFGYLNGVWDFIILRKKLPQKHTELSR